MRVRVLHACVAWVWGGRGRGRSLRAASALVWCSTALVCAEAVQYGPRVLGCAEVACARTVRTQPGARGRASLVGCVGEREGEGECMGVPG